MICLLSEGLSFNVLIKTSNDVMDGCCSEDLAIPWRWTGPEVFLEECWYWKSDVWSFGVTMWEVRVCDDNTAPGSAHLM